MSVTFVHTADWQIGKPFAGVEEAQKRATLQNERLAAIRRIGDVVREHNARFVVVAGDLFDSPSPTKTTVSAACSAIGSLGVPVVAIPGNHDHGGPGSLWEESFFLREQQQLAPNLRVLLAAEPVELDEAVLFPCPLLRRHEAEDPTAWLRALEMEHRFTEKARIALVHGSILDFGGSADDDEGESGVPNLIDLPRLPETLFDYVALGDWHGTKRITASAWYSGTPELDRFVKGEDHNPGNVLVVKVDPGRSLNVEPVRTGRIAWHDLEFGFTDDNSVQQFEEQLIELVGPRVNEDLLKLRLSGSLGLAACASLDNVIESLHARLLRLKLVNGTQIAPTDEEINALTRRAGDPLISRVAAQLVVQASGADESAATARVALRELHAVCLQN
jgi:DNA repair exonuclease SbcCD nuclease subunit